MLEHFESNFQFYIDIDFENMECYGSVLTKFDARYSNWPTFDLT